MSGASSDALYTNARLVIEKIEGTANKYKKCYEHYDLKVLIF